MTSTIQDQIFIRDLHLRCIIGIQEWERHTKQDVLITVAITADLTTAGRSDNIDDTINYKKLTKQIIALTEGSSFQLVEALAEAIASLGLSDPRVTKVAVDVEKPGAVRFSRSVGVHIERLRPSE
ncbi:MAG: dihydroneopterin aldolase [Magnetococcales bacterium]|nr:dihydroneopterin aldolase [Magnetococcales bacterium]